MELQEGRNAVFWD